MDVEKDVFHFEWKIENFPFAAHGTGQCLSSPPFRADILDETRWAVLLYPRGKENEDYIDIALKREVQDYGGNEIPIKFAIELEAVDSSLHERCESDTILFTHNSCHMFHGFIQRSSLFEMQETLIPNECLTIHCTLWREEVQDLLIKEFMAVTKVSARQCVFNWQIPNWSKILLPEYCDPDKTEAPYIMDVTFQGETKPFFRLYLCRNNHQDNNVRLDVVKLDPNLNTILKSRIAMVDNDNTEILASETVHQFNTGKDFFAISFSSSTLFPTSEIADLYPPPDDVLRLKCELSIPSGSHQSSIKNVIHQSLEDEPDTTEDNFSRDLENLQNEGKFCDVKIKAGDVIIPCHKFILYAKSPVLNKILSNLEQNKKEVVVIDIESVDGPTVKQLIHFMYTEKIESLQYASALKLLAAAQKFQILNLKDKCSEYLKAALTFENVSDIVIAADLHDVQDLMECSLEYITKYWNEISVTQEWEDFILARPNLHKRIHRQIRANKLNC